MTLGWLFPQQLLEKKSISLNTIVKALRRALPSLNPFSVLEQRDNRVDYDRLLCLSQGNASFYCLRDV
ncbi:hypothetical protein E2C01_060606 [Portunus trituberculatus]|uniref:Uncharacterized protein n=1 Tax=Portunus trituberculatus TaxID=210409 RepID=A0A5B7HBW7_PORTR|nr:hypothetical protein [Portunus trituberculatus]